MGRQTNVREVRESGLPPNARVAPRAGAGGQAPTQMSESDEPLTKARRRCQSAGGGFNGVGQKSCPFGDGEIAKGARGRRERAVSAIDREPSPHDRQALDVKADEPPVGDLCGDRVG